MSIFIVLGSLLLLFFITGFVVISIAEHRRLKKEMDNTFISYQYHGIGEKVDAYLVSTDTLYGKKGWICPKCHSKNTNFEYNLLGMRSIYCRDCRHEHYQ